MPELLAALAAFLQEHGGCGELDGDVDGVEGTSRENPLCLSLVGEEDRR